jgi:signal transduction histidine kinase
VVRDTGVGIPEQDRQRVFDRFYRVDKARSRALGGAGLGLSIVRWIVEVHGGKIHIDSVPGRGSTFTVDLPLSVEP